MKTKHLFAILLFFVLPFVSGAQPISFHSAKLKLSIDGKIANSNTDSLYINYQKANDLYVDSLKAFVFSIPASVWRFVIEYYGKKMWITTYCPTSGEDGVETLNFIPGKFIFECNKDTIYVSDNWYSGTDSISVRFNSKMGFECYQFNESACKNIEPVYLLEKKNSIGWKEILKPRNCGSNLWVSFSGVHCCDFKFSSAGLTPGEYRVTVLLRMPDPTNKKFKYYPRYNFEVEYFKHLSTASFTIL